MKNQLDCLILIDGSNFYFKLKSFNIHNLLSFDFTKFADFLIDKKNSYQICYYVGKIRQDGTKKAEKLFDGQQKLIGHLKKHKVKYILGYLLKSDGVYHEKGVDVQIAVDMVVSAYENSCKKIILVSSDTDLAPAIRKAQERGKTVKYVGFSNKKSLAMINFCKESRILSKEDLLQFVQTQEKNISASMTTKKPHAKSKIRN